MTRVHAFTDDALGDHDAVGLVEALHSGAVSVPELVEAAIARTERVDPELNAVAYTAYDEARAQARDPLGGFFSGVPTFVKDNVDVAGMPTCHGTDAWVGRPCRSDGDFARMYRLTGLVTLGKTRLSEYGFPPTVEHPRLGPVRNPWSTDHTAGGSSAGSAALVAAGAVPLAHAMDGGGSIRIPASVNGLVGLKPTRDRVPQDKMVRDQPVRICADGVLTRTVRDTAAFIRESEKIYRNLALPPVGDITRPGRNRLRVSVVTSAMGQEASPEVAELTLKVAAVLEELGHTVVEGDVPDLDPRFKEDFLTYWATLSLFLLQNGRRLHGRTWDRSRHDAFTVGLARHATRNLHRLPGAITRLRRSRHRSADYFRRYDVVLAPTLAAETPRIGHLDPTQDFDVVMARILDWISFTPLQNATGDPAISLPLATTSGGLPLGMQLAAGAGREALLLELAYEIEEAIPFASIRTASARPARAG
jgi:amidase